MGIDMIDPLHDRPLPILDIRITLAIWAHRPYGSRLANMGYYTTPVR